MEFVVRMLYGFEQKKASDFSEALCLLRGPYWVRTSDPLLVRQVL